MIMSENPKMPIIMHNTAKTTVTTMLRKSRMKIVNAMSKILRKSFIGSLRIEAQVSPQVS
jgi:hypothetical protein